MTLGRKVQIICDLFYGKLLLTLRDDSSPLISSLQIKVLSQGLFFPAYFISADINSLSGIILPR